jgi:hypothetical protein
MAAKTLQRRRYRMEDITVTQPDITGCLLKLVLFILGFALLVIFMVGALAGIVIASTL